MGEWWDKWFGRPQAGIEYDQFVSDFAKRFEKENHVLLNKDPQEYWRMFRQEKEQAWLDYKVKK